MFINHVRVAFAEPHKIDNVAEDLGQALVRWLLEILEGEVGDATFEEKLAQRDIEAHEIAHIRWNNIHKFPAYIFCCGAHRRINSFVRRIHEKLSKPLEDLLDLERVRLL